MTQPHDDPSIGFLRETHGPGFAPQFQSEDKLSSLLESTGTTSLEEYLTHSRRGMQIVGTTSDVANTFFSHTMSADDAALLRRLVTNFGALQLADDSDEDEDQDMSSLRRDETGVDNTIFVSTKGRAQHAPRIKIAIDPPDSFNATSKTASMAFHDYSITGAYVPPHIVEQATRFIERNRDVLLRYWDAKISTREMLDQIRKPD
jgi:hypothetical protein